MSEGSEQDGRYVEDAEVTALREAGQAFGRAQESLPNEVCSGQIDAFVAVLEEEFDALLESMDGVDGFDREVRMTNLRAIAEDPRILERIVTKCSRDLSEVVRTANYNVKDFIRATLSRFLRRDLNDPYSRHAFSESAPEQPVQQEVRHRLRAAVTRTVTNDIKTIQIEG